MKRSGKSGLGVPMFLALFPLAGCAHQYRPLQAHQMIADVEPAARGHEEMVAGQPRPMPLEPLLFEMAKDLPPAAMAGDADVPARRLSLPSIRETRPQPTPLPAEPAPR